MSMSNNNYELPPGRNQQLLAPWLQCTVDDAALRMNNALPSPIATLNTGEAALQPPATRPNPPCPRQQ